MNDLESLYMSLKAGSNEVFVDEALRKAALVPLNRMLDFNKN